MDYFSVAGLKKHFGGIAVLDDLSVVFQQGRIIGIVGPNGSGKTTLLNVLSGLVALDDGKVEINGEELKKTDTHQIYSLGLARTFQEIRLFNQLSVRDNLLMALSARRVIPALLEYPGIKQTKIAERILKRFNLEDKAEAPAGELSYGQRKLLEIGRALALDAEIYLMDEPFAGLFSEAILAVSDAIKEMSARGRMVILVEHDLERIKDLCGEVVVIDGGRVIAQGRPDEVFSKPAVVQAYLGAPQQIAD